MALYLVQHGKSLPKEIDPDQGLSEEGISDVERISEVAKHYRINVSWIQHSGKKRALQTAEIFDAALEPPKGVHERSGLKPMDDVTAFSRAINCRENVMVVGHLPFMEKLTSYLITGFPDKRIFKFQNGGIVCLDQDTGDQSWHIKWTLMPDIG